MLVKIARKAILVVAGATAVEDTAQANDEVITIAEKAILVVLGAMAVENMKVGHQPAIPAGLADHKAVMMETKWELLR